MQASQNDFAIQCRLCSAKVNLLSLFNGKNKTNRKYIRQIVEFTTGIHYRKNDNFQFICMGCIAYTYNFYVFSTKSAENEEKIMKLSLHHQSDNPKPVETNKRFQYIELLEYEEVKSKLQPWLEQKQESIFLNSISDKSSSASEKISSETVECKKSKNSMVEVATQTETPSKSHVAVNTSLKQGLKANVATQTVDCSSKQETRDRTAQRDILQHSKSVQCYIKKHSKKQYNVSSQTCSVSINKSTQYIKEDPNKVNKSYKQDMTETAVKNKPQKRPMLKLADFVKTNNSFKKKFPDHSDKQQTFETPKEYENCLAVNCESARIEDMKVEEMTPRSSIHSKSSPISFVMSPLTRRSETPLEENSVSPSSSKHCSSSTTRISEIPLDGNSASRSSSKHCNSSLTEMNLLAIQSRTPISPSGLLRPLSCAASETLDVCSHCDCILYSETQKQEHNKRHNICTTCIKQFRTVSETKEHRRQCLEAVYPTPFYVILTKLEMSKEILEKYPFVKDKLKPRTSRKRSGAHESSKKSEIKKSKQITQ